MTYKYATLIKWINVVVDYLLLNLGLFIGFLLESHSAFWDIGADNYRLNFLLLNLFWFYSSTMVKLYDQVLLREAWPTLMASIKALLMYLITPIAVTLLLPNYHLPVESIIRSYILFSFFIISWKLTFLSIRKYRRKYWVSCKKVAIIGASPGGIELYRYIEMNPDLGYKVAGIFDDSLSQEQDNQLRVLGKIEDCFSYAHAQGVTEVFSALPLQEMDRARSLMQQADKLLIRFRIVPDVKTYFDKNALLDKYGSLPILTLRKEPLDNKANEIIKRAFDIVFSLLVIVTLLSWLIPLIAIAIKLESRGPVFFKQLRSGKQNKPFYCFKFRSMQVNADADSRQVRKGDTRITRVGAILRKTSLDELPQFFNVLMGQMSVVGPRPHMLKHTQDYSLLIGNFMVRHFLTPGITGWAQVNGYRGETKETIAMSKRVDADVWYLENWTLFLDLKIIFLTVWHMFRGDMNAY